MEEFLIKKIGAKLKLEANQKLMKAKIVSDHRRYSGPIVAAKQNWYEWAAYTRARYAVEAISGKRISTSTRT